VRVNESEGEPTSVDVVVNNLSENTAVLHNVRLDIIEVTSLEKDYQPGIGPLLPIAALYDTSLTPETKQIDFKVVHSVLPHLPDRLVLLIRLGTRRADGLPQSVRISTDSDTIIARMVCRARLTLQYNDDQSITSEEFLLPVSDLLIAERLSDTNLLFFRDRLKLLDDDYYGVIEATMELAERLGDTTALSKLIELRSKDPQRMLKSYADQVEFLEMLEEGISMNSPQQWHKEFIAKLDSAIAKLSRLNPKKEKELP
jgi:hypothetical protein